MAEAGDVKINCTKKLWSGFYDNGTFRLDVPMAPNKAMETRIVSDPSLLQLANTNGSLAICPIFPLASRAMLWLRRLGYPHPGRLILGVHQQIFRGTNLPLSLTTAHLDISAVDAYHDAKAKTQQHPNNFMEKHSTRPYEFIHMDMKHMPYAGIVWRC